MPYKNGRPVAQQWAQAAKRAGVSLTWYLAQWAFQGGVCAVCGKSERAATRGTKPMRLAVDHNHKTEARRGLLCLSCNTKLAWLDAPPERATRYLASYRSASE